MSKNNKTEDCTHTVDEPDDNGKSTTARSKKVQRRRKGTKPTATPKPLSSTPTSNNATDDQKTDTATDKRSNRSESTNRSTSSISSTRNENDAAAAAAAASLPTQPQRSKVKRFFLKISEKMGTVEQTQYSSEFNDAVQDVDNYKKCLEDVLHNLVYVTQRNPKLQCRPLERLEFEYPDNTNPYELLYPVMNNFCGFLNGADVKKQAEMASKLGVLHRGFHRRSRRSLRNIRKFLCEDYDIVCDARKVLNDRRQEMDFAKHELKTAKTPEVMEMKNTVYENSQKHFETQLQKVLVLIDQTQKVRDLHLKDIQTWQTIYKVYHEQMSQILSSK